MECAPAMFVGAILLHTAGGTLTRLTDEVQTAREGQSATFACKTDTLQPIRWKFHVNGLEDYELINNRMKVSQKLATRFNVTFDEMSGNGTLVILAAQRHDVGIYTCSESHSAVKEIRFTLFVGDIHLTSVPLTTTTSSYATTSRSPVTTYIVQSVFSSTENTDAVNSKSDADSASHGASITIGLMCLLAGCAVVFAVLLAVVIRKRQSNGFSIMTSDVATPKIGADQPGNSDAISGPPSDADEYATIDVGSMDVRLRLSPYGNVPDGNGRDRSGTDNTTRDLSPQRLSGTTVSAYDTLDQKSVAKRPVQPQPVYLSLKPDIGTSELRE